MISLPLQPKIVEKKENLARFEIEALYPGYGITIGNSLRRVLLSSLPGAAITQVKIKGIQHEFSTIPGALEDVISVMLNLKQLRFKFFGDEPQRAVLKVKGEREVLGSDFETSSQVELVNKSCHVATLTDKKAELDIEVLIEKGIGYITREARQEKSAGTQEKLEIGVIAMDAIFTPMKNVSIKVENMRVGERTDFDKLTLDIETDGTISPEEAFVQANEILVNHFSLLAASFQKEEKPVDAETSDSETEKGDTSKAKIEDLKLSSRTLNALLKNNVKSITAVTRKSEEELLEMEGMGDKAIKEIKKGLKKLGLELKSKE